LSSIAYSRSKKIAMRKHLYPLLLFIPILSFADEVEEEIEADAVMPSISSENFCETGKPHPIDIWFETAMDKIEGVTVNIRNVQGEAYSRWGNEMNRIFNELIKKFNKEEKKALNNAQQAWILFSNAEAELWWSDAVYGGIGGTLAPIIVSGEGLELLRQRACTLLKYNKL